jgi:signal transduction histidine kinase
MSEANEVCERRSVDAATDEINMALHEMCQPLTTLQCRLEMAELVGTVEAYREAIDVGLAECSRLVRTVESMRAALRATRQAG